MLLNVLVCLHSDWHLRKCPVGETGSNVQTLDKNILWPPGTRHFGRFVARSFGIVPNCHADLVRVVSSRGDLKGGTLRYNKSHAAHLATSPFNGPGEACLCLYINATCKCHILLITSRTDARKPLPQEAPRAVAGSVNLISRSARVYIQHHCLF